MARQRIARAAFALATIALPFTYASKELLGDLRATWVDPTMVLGVGILALVGWRLRRRPGWFLIVLAFMSAVAGWSLHRVEPGRGHADWFVVLRDPISLALCLVWFWVCIIFFVREREFAVRWLAIGVIFQLALAVYLYLAIFQLVPMTGPVQTFTQDYRAGQTLWVGALGIPRMGGTFQESPLFGLYMLSCFVILTLEWTQRRGGRRSFWLSAGEVASALGVLASLSTQVLLAFGLFLILLSLRYARARAAWRVGALVVGVVAAVFAGRVLHRNMQSGTVVPVYLGSVPERSFHARYALRIIEGQPTALLLGIGPGRYGDYAAATGLFPSTVTPQTMAVEWLLGYGALGLGAICFWLYGIGVRAWRYLGIAGLAAFLSLLAGDMFQARWLWEAWFMALAYLYASGAYPVLSRPKTVLAAGWQAEPRAGFRADREKRVPLGTACPRAVGRGPGV